MIYAMPGMETKLHAVLNKPGQVTRASPPTIAARAFRACASRVYGRERCRLRPLGGAATRSGGGLLDAQIPTRRRAAEREGPRAALRSRSQPGLFDADRQMCVEPGTTCMGETMAHDMKGEMGGTMGHAHARADQQYRQPQTGRAGGRAAARSEGRSARRRARHRPPARRSIRNPPSLRSVKVSIMSPELLKIHLRALHARIAAAARTDRRRDLRARSRWAARRCVAVLTYYKVWGYLWTRMVHQRRSQADRRSCT